MKVKAHELRQKNASDLRDLLKKQLEDKFKFTMQHGNGQLSKSHQLQVVQRNIARIKTLLHEMNLNKRNKGA